MENLQFIDIITHVDRNNSSDDIKNACDTFLQYCRNPTQFEDILFIHEMLSAQMLRKSSRWHSKKKSYPHHMHIRGGGDRRGTHTHRRVQDAISARRTVLEHTTDRAIRAILEPRIRKAGARGDTILLGGDGGIPERGRTTGIVRMHSGTFRAAAARTAAQTLPDPNAGFRA